MRTGQKHLSIPCKREFYVGILFSACPSFYSSIVLSVGHSINVYAPNFEKVDGAYCFWSVRAWAWACLGASHFLYLL